ncbi:MAG: DUF692 domain-containing protein [Thioalkalivibrio sp.]|nr:MAG: DUF692 domain-containing protein [Thioalkalivibrio sp.]
MPGHAGGCAAAVRNRPVAPIPASAGVGLKPAHYQHILEHRPAIGWFEVHPENYMGAGGPPHRYLEAIRELYPLSLHGVGLSIGGAGRLDRAHLERLATLVRRYQPALFSEHLAWSTHTRGFMNDLLPLPYNEETLAHVAGHVAEVQDALGRRMLVENPATYLRFEDSSIAETQFLEELATRTGCGLLLDVNNVYVSGTNHGFDPPGYLDRFPTRLVEEIHVAGHVRREDDLGQPLLIDSHDAPVADPVWALLEQALQVAGPLPVLVEWDSSIPAWDGLMREATRAQRILHARTTEHRRHAATA